MSRRAQWQKNQYLKNNKNEPFLADDARIVRIKTVHNPVLRALIADVHREYFDISQNPNHMMALEEAQAIWRRDPRQIDRAEEKEGEGVAGSELGGTFEEEMPDVDSYISEVMLQDSHEFNADMHDWYQRHKRALHIRAVVLVSYANDSKFAKVSGDWCSLSRSLKFRIRGRVEDIDVTDPSDPISVVDASSKNEDDGIELARFTSISGTQFNAMLVEKGMHVNECRMHVRQYFATSSPNLVPANTTPTRAQAVDNPTVYQSNRAYANAVAIERRRQQLLTPEPVAVPNGALRDAQIQQGNEYHAALANQVTITDLWNRIVASNVDIKKFLETEYTELSLRMALLSPQLDEIRDMYDSRDVQLEAVARGAEFIRTLYRLMQQQPAMLCFPETRAQFSDQAQLRSLALLPNLSYDSCKKLFAKYRAGEDHRDKLAAIDIYNNILRIDVYGDGKPPSPQSPTSNHTFTVFAVHPDDRRARYYHKGAGDEKSSMPDPISKLRDQNTMSEYGRFALPDDVKSLLPPSMNRDLSDDCRRLQDKQTGPAALVRGLRWLLEINVIKRERFTGTGEHNKGMPVDAFYLTSIHDTQQRVVKALVDIYRRGVKQSMHRAPDKLADAHFTGLVKAAIDERNAWRDEYKVAAKVTNDLQAARRREQNVAASAVDADDEDDPLVALANRALPATSGSAQAAAAAPPSNNALPMTLLARKIAKREQELVLKYEKFVQEGRHADVGDAYADARKGHLVWRAPLLLLQEPPMRLPTGHAFDVHQIAALKDLSPIKAFSGRGGAGKTELILHECKRYLPEQVMCVAFTGQVASELSRRTSFRASTIHSVLFRHTRFMEAFFRARAFRKHALSKRNSRPDEAGESFDYAKVLACTSDRELRAYVESKIAAYPPFASPFENTRMLVIDEVSLLALPLFARLIEAAHCPAQGRFIERLILVGDLDQLPAIGYGNIQSDITHGLPNAVHELVTNHRSKGVDLFNLAQAIAEHRYEMPIPRFDMTSARRELQRAGGADIVCMETMSIDVHEKLECVLSYLGADKNESVRGDIQGLATTNHEVDAANDETRWVYFGAPMLQADRQGGAVQLIQRTLTQEQHTAASAAKKDEREQLMKQLKMQVRVGDRIHFTKNSRLIFKARNEGEEDQEVNLYNSRMLEAVQFYDAPKRIVASLHCRCGLCPPRPEHAPREYKSPCMHRLDLVPPMRRRRALRSEADASHYFEYHDERMTRRNENGRRMAVFREDSGNYIEVDVARQMKPNSRWKRGFFTTTHKMQGAQKKCIIYVVTNAQFFINWKYLYTAATRAQERLIILSTDEVFDQLVRRKEPVRLSMLWYTLFDEIATVLRQHPNSACARRAALVCPQMLDRGIVDAGERWNVFEAVRYRTDVPRPSPPDAMITDDDATTDEQNIDDDGTGTDEEDVDDLASPEESTREEDALLAQATTPTLETSTTRKRGLTMADIFLKRIKK